MNDTLKSFLKSTAGFTALLHMIRIIPLKIISVYGWKILAQKKDIKLELGSGSKKGVNGFTTVDFFGADLHRDLRKGVPLPDNSVSFIYSSHMLEHIPYLELPLFLEECRRLLKKGGSMSVCVPNAKNYIQAYIEKRFFRDMKNCYKPAYLDTGSYIDQVNYTAYMAGEHFYMFDEDNLVNIFKIAGFSKVELRSYDAMYDQKEREYESIYAIAHK